MGNTSASDQIENIFSHAKNQTDNLSKIKCQNQKKTLKGKKTGMNGIYVDQDTRFPFLVFMSTAHDLH